LQVNGGGGVLFNDNPSVESLKTIAAAHYTLGTTQLLPTLITDTPNITQRAIEAAINAAIDATNSPASERSALSSIAGLHLEGPHLSVEKKGAHDPALIRPMNQSDLELLLNASQQLPTLKVTVAPENVSLKQVQALSEAGVLIALGHTNANYKTCIEYHKAGARCVTHLYNAMSQLSSREPGLVGAALSTDTLSIGLIADGVHVHPASVRAAWAIKARTGRCYLVTDAMATADSSLNSFTLNGRTIHRQDGRLTLDDGTLAGADTDLTQSISFLVNKVGVELKDALKAAQSTSNIIRISSALNRVSYVTN